MALTALQNGRAALDRGDVAAALTWLERAHRYAPDDPAPLLSLAAARLAAGDAAGALDEFRTVARARDVREGWLGEAVACLRLGRAAEAATALGRCFSHHRWDGEAGVADAVTAAARLPGWCALAPDGTVAFRLRRPGRLPAISVDGVDLPPGGAVAPAAGAICVTMDGRDLLGSPIQAARIRRLDGAVRSWRGGLDGWAWHPGDAGRDPVLTLRAGAHRRSVLAEDQGMASPQPLTRPRRFTVSATALAGFDGPIDVTGADGTALAGSPVDPHAPSRSAAAIARQVARRWPFQGAAAAGNADREFAWAAVPADIIGGPAAAPRRPARRVAVVIPAHRGHRETIECLHAVRRTAPADTEVLVIDDASPEPALAAALDGLAGRGLIRLLRLERNVGFPGAANAGLRAASRLAGKPDIVLLNSDTRPAPGWVEALRAAVHGSPNIGTATPLSNDASIATYPDPDAATAAAAAAADGASLALLGRQAARANPGITVDIPTAVGFCLYLRRECLEQTGVLREDVFAQGYGEENDFCLRARHLGWRHVAVPGAYVAHLGGRSFGPMRAALLARNMQVLESLHPGYAAMIAEWVARDPLHPARRRLDARRWAAACRGAPPAVLLLTHDSGGGVERCVQARVATLRAQGRRPLLLRPVLDRSARAAAEDRRYRVGLCRIDEPGQQWPNLRFEPASELRELAALLRAARLVGIEVHHLLGHDHAVLDLARALGVPYQVRMHDYAWFCPRITLIGAAGRYCGEPDSAGCEACVADLGSRLEEAISVPSLLARSAADLSGASRVVAPSRDAAQRLARHFPALRPAVEPHEADAYATAARLPARVRLVCVIGAIGQEKGYDVLLACARDAAARGLDLRFAVVGHTIDDARLLDTGQVTITGPFLAEEAEALIRAQAADIGFIPSIWPETWCLALGEAWRAGLAVAAFDLGAPAERIRAAGRGWLLPLGLPGSRVNNALLTLPPLAAERRVMQTGQVRSARAVSDPFAASEIDRCPKRLPQKPVASSRPASARPTSSRS